MAAGAKDQIRGVGELRQHNGILEEPSSKALQRCMSITSAAVRLVPGAAALRGVSKQNRLLAFLATNLVFMVVEFIYGYMNNSLGMLSDAAHMLLDNVAVTIGLAAEYYAAKCKRNGATCDPVRIRLLAGFANAVILMFVALNIVLEAAVHVLGAGHDVTTHRLLPVSIGGLVVNIMGLVFVHEAHHHGIPSSSPHGDHHHGSPKTGSGCGCTKSHGDGGVGDPNTRAILLHIMADTLGSMAVVLSTLAMQHFHWHWADPVASVTIASLIMLAVWPLVKHSAVLLLEAPAARSHAAHTSTHSAPLLAHEPATTAPPHVEAALRTISCMEGVTIKRRHRCTEVAPGSYSVSVQLEVPQGTSAAAAEQISQQAALIMHKSSSISEVYVQTSRPGVAAESALSSQICDHNDESAEIPAVHVAAPQPSFQANENGKRSSMEVASTFIRRSIKAGRHQG